MFHRIEFPDHIPVKDLFRASDRFDFSVSDTDDPVTEFLSQIQFVKRHHNRKIPFPYQPPQDAQKLQLVPDIQK